MTDPLPGKRYGAIQAWPEPTDAAKATRWRYLPAAPAPQRNPAGKPQVTMIEAGAVLMLTVGANLGVDEAALAAARAQIAAETGQSPQAVELSPAEAAVKGASLAFEQSGAPAKQLAQARTSTFLPAPAAFSAMLQGDDAAATKAALDAGRGRLVVRYEIDLGASRTATARVEGAWTDDADVAALLSQGRLTVTLEADAGASDELVAAVRAEATRLAQEAVARCAAGPDGGPINRGPTATTRSGVVASATRSETAPRAIELAADVGDWI